MDFWFLVYYTIRGRKVNGIFFIFVQKYEIGLR